MPKKLGRKRVVDWAEVARRVAAYCSAWGVELPLTGLPPYPAGQARKPQERAWLNLYKAHDRLVRYESGVCERCSAPRDPDVVHCPKHRATNCGRAGMHGANYMQRKALHDKRGGVCPICSKPVKLWDGVDHDHKTGNLRGILHGNCNRFVGLLEKIGPNAALAAVEYLNS